MEDTRQADCLSGLLRPWDEDDRPCAPSEFRVRWDQWAVCTMTCQHGSWRGVSRGQLDMFEAVRDAFANFNTGHIGIAP